MVEEVSAAEQPLNGWPALLELTPAGPALIGSRCNSCAYVAFPPMAVCPRCFGEETMERFRLSSRATLDNYTVVHQATKGFTAPYIQAFVRMPEGPLVFTHVAGCEPIDGALTPGEPMLLTTGIIKRDVQGRPVLGYKFRPSRETQTHA